MYIFLNAIDYFLPNLHTIIICFCRIVILSALLSTAVTSIQTTICITIAILLLIGILSNTVGLTSDTETIISQISTSKRTQSTSDYLEFPTAQAISKEQSNCSFKGM